MSKNIAFVKGVPDFVSVSQICPIESNTANAIQLVLWQSGLRAIAQAILIMYVHNYQDPEVLDVCGIKLSSP